MSATMISTLALPPPTSNNLTPAQRIRLQRSTRKIGKVLGATPHLLDSISGPMKLQAGDRVVRDKPALHVHLPIGRSTSASCAPHRSSISSSASSPSTPSSASSSASSASTVSLVTPTSSAGHSPTIISISISPSMRTKKQSSTSTLQRAAPDEFVTRHPLHRPPLLRLDLHPSPSTLRRTAKGARHAGYALSDSLSSSTPLHPHPHPLLPTTTPQRDSYLDVGPHFLVRTEAAERRAKMERVKKRLGSGVPVGLVFPFDSFVDADVDLPELWVEGREEDEQKRSSWVLPGPTPGYGATSPTTPVFAVHPTESSPSPDRLLPSPSSSGFKVRRKPVRYQREVELDEGVVEGEGEVEDGGARDEKGEKDVGREQCDHHQPASPSPSTSVHLTLDTSPPSRAELDVDDILQSYIPITPLSCISECSLEGESSYARSLTSQPYAAPSSPSSLAALRAPSIRSTISTSTSTLGRSTTWSASTTLGRPERSVSGPRPLVRRAVSAGAGAGAGGGRFPRRGDSRVLWGAQ